MKETVFFRPDIEGLRAVAVLLVLACHAGVPWLTGGYVGVDVFFVISGYLITGLLLREFAAHGTIDLAGFYARRIRRLIPALALVMVAVLAGIYLLSSPLEQPLLLRSALAAVLYISNLHFAWQSTDYWGHDAKHDPLLHTWSLGVEEQFYLVWPLLILVSIWSSRRVGRPWLVGVVLLLTALLSLVMAVREVAVGQPMYAFFLPFMRAWEFGAGAVVALYAKELDRLASWLRVSAWWHLHRLLGMSAVLLPAVMYGDETVFPGWAALLPVMGAAWLIWGMGITRAGPAMVLSSRFCQWCGRLSYGWYLWHWPLLVFYLMVYPEAALWERLAVVMVALLLAAFSYHALELPVRQGTFFRAKAFAYGLAIVVPAVIMTASLYLADVAGLRAAQPEYERLLAQRGIVPALYREGCDPGLSGILATPCRGGSPEGKRSIVLVGDSHAGQWASAFDAIAKSKGWHLLLYTKSACPMVDADFHYGRLGRIYTECRVWRQAVLDEIESIKPDMVVMSNSENYPFSEKEWLHGERGVAVALAKSSRHLVILRDTPLPRIDIPNCLARKLWQPDIYPAACSFASGSARSDRLDILHRSVARSIPDAAYLDMTSAICAQARCNVMSGDIAKFRDDNHLSDAYVMSLTPALMQRLSGLGLF